MLLRGSAFADLGEIFSPLVADCSGVMARLVWAPPLTGSERMPTSATKGIDKGQSNWERGRVRERNFTTSACCELQVKLLQMLSHCLLLTARPSVTLLLASASHDNGEEQQQHAQAESLASPCHEPLAHEQGSTACSDPSRAELLAAAGLRPPASGRQQAACAYSSYFKFRPSAGSLLLSETLDLVRAGCRQA